MVKFVFTLCCALIAAPLMAQEASTPEADARPVLSITDVTDETLSDFTWASRVLIIFADSGRDPRIIDQISLLEEDPEALLEREIIVLRDVDPAAKSALRTALRPRGFSIVIIGKDGKVGLRRPAPRDVREIVRAVDNFQLRKEELARAK